MVEQLTSRPELHGLGCIGEPGDGAVVVAGEETAQKALAHLKAEGLIRAEVGLGSLVAKRPEESDRQA